MTDDTLYVPGTKLLWSAVPSRIDVALWVFDIDVGRVVWANSRALQVWNAQSYEELYSRDMGTGMSPAVRSRLQQYQSDFQSHNAVFNESWTLYPRGVPVPLKVRFSGVVLADGRMATMCEGYEDNSIKPDSLRANDALMHTRLMISMHSVDGQSLYLNPSARTTFARTSRDLKSWFVNEADYRHLVRTVTECGESSITCEVDTVSGPRWHELTARSCKDPASGQPAFLVSQTDVSQLKQAEAWAHRLAHTDPMTQLPNRLALPQAFETMRSTVMERAAKLTLFFVDLDQFKLVNDMMGHRTGDELLKDVADRLLTFANSHADMDCQVVRLGGDEFLLLAFIPEEGWQEHCDVLSGELCKVLYIVLADGTRRYVVTPSIGISLYPDHGHDTEALIQSADLAMQQAKHAGRNRAMVFEPRMRESLRQQTQLAADLAEAIANDEIELYFQPRFSTNDESMLAAEALVRWRHKTQGMISPVVFIPLCEKSDLIEKLGMKVLSQALAQQRRWRATGADLSVSVNVSLRQLANPAFGQWVVDMLDVMGADPKKLELELTESALTEATEILQKNLGIIRSKGIKISIDDFGTGYSNLARLSEMSIDCIKIDRSFMQKLPDSKELVKMVVTMCKLMKANVVAEGIETVQAVQWVRELGCDEIQGYYYAKPMPADDFLKMVEEKAPKKS